MSENFEPIDLAKPKNDPMAQEVILRDVSNSFTKDPVGPPNAEAHQKFYNGLTVIAVLLLLLGGYLMIPRSASMREETVALEESAPAVIPAEESPAESAIQETESESEADVASRLTWEERRLQELRGALNAVNVRHQNAQFVKSQLQAAERDLQEVQMRLNANAQSETDIGDQAQALQRDQKIATNNTAINIENQIQNINNSIAQLQNQLKQVPTENTSPSETAISAAATAITPSPATTDPGVVTPAPAVQGNPTRNAIESQISQLEQQRLQLESSLAIAEKSGENESLSIAQQAQNQNREVRTEKQNLERQRQDLQTSLEYWKQQEATSPDNANLRVNRLRLLQNQVTEQERQVAELREKARPPVR